MSLPPFGKNFRSLQYREQQTSFLTRPALHRYAGVPEGIKVQADLEVMLSELVLR
jgi:hypothetical protein